MENCINTVAITELFDWLYLCEKQLTAGQMDFIREARKQFRRNKSLSERQFEVLKDIRKHLPAEHGSDVRLNNGKTKAKDDF
jgi:hypothetical protein